MHSDSREEPSRSPERRWLVAFDEAAGETSDIQHASLDADALWVCHKLRDHGHQAYLVGGCVRDLMLGGRPKDFDVATSAHPGQIRAIFRNCRLIGRRFRLAHVFFRNNKVIETATFRANPNEELEDVSGDVLITRDNVFGSAEEDARRRDFTVNGLFYDVVLGRVIDYVGGREDLGSRLLRTIGDPDVRLREDPVRILRAVRFAAKCGLDIEDETWRMMQKHAGDLARCAPPRVLEEIFRLLRSGHSRRCFELLRECGALPVLLPPVAEYLARVPEEQADEVFLSLGLLDHTVKGGTLPSDDVLLSVLLAHLSQQEAKLHRPAAPAPLLLTDVAHEQAPAEGEGAASSAAEVSLETAAIVPVPAQEEPEELEEEPGPQLELREASPEEAAKSAWATSAAAARTVDGLLAELVRVARLPRRMAERARLVLYAQRILSGARRRRGSPAAFARQPYFADALFVFDLFVRATGRGTDALQKWKSRLAPPAPPKVEGAEAELEEKLEEPLQAAPQPATERAPREERRREPKGGPIPAELPLRPERTAQRRALANLFPF